MLAPTAWHELVADVLARPGCTGVAFGPRSLASSPVPPGSTLVRAFFDERDDGSELRAALRRALGALAARTGAAELEGLAPVFARLPPEDWATTWRKVWRPMRVGRVCVVGPEHAAPLRPGDVRLELEPGAAFGTGRHATTRACLFALQRRLEPGAAVLDAGCGTGILAVAACLLGARRALGFDVDRAAIEHSVELAARNGVAARCTFRQVSFAGLGEGAEALGFDGAVANLYADLILEHGRDLAARLRPGGWFAVSGCTADRRPQVERALEAAGLRVEEGVLRGRWATFEGRLGPG